MDARVQGGVEGGRWVYLKKGNKRDACNGTIVILYIDRGENMNLRM